MANRADIDTDSVRIMLQKIMHTYLHIKANSTGNKKPRAYIQVSSLSDT